MTEEKPKKGFARMTPEQRREAGRRGALALHRKGKAHRFTSETGSEAAKKRIERQREKGAA